MTYVIQHGALRLPSVTVDAYNEEIPDGDGFLGDRASRRAFRAVLDSVRKRGQGPDPLGAAPTESFRKAEIDRWLVHGTPEQAAVVHTAVEEFAQTFAGVLRRFLAQPSWAGTERVVVGGGFSDSRVGHLVVGRAQLLLREEGLAVDLRPIRHHPDEAGLLGGMHLAPSWVFRGHDCILAMDVGGSNIRAGLVVMRHGLAPDLSRARVEGLEHWRHRDEKPSRAAVVERMVDMLRRLCRRAEKEGHLLAPFIALGCPGMIEADGQIERGAQNLPGDWEQERFNLPELLHDAIPRIEGHRTDVGMHNDAVVQGLSEIPFMQDVRHWGVLTVGTGLGNARFTNRTER